VLNPYSGVRWSSPFDPAWYGGLGYYGFGYWTTNSGEPTELAFHDFLHYPGAFPEGGYGIPKRMSVAA
jgi:hypothetical protein